MITIRKTYDTKMWIVYLPDGMYFEATTWEKALEYANAHIRFKFQSILDAAINRVNCE